jgi:UDP-3-O-[3-hydroxymyristoyl] glucosamine N-acyltransferase
MQIAAKEIARLLGGVLEGDGDALVDRPGKIEEGGAGALTFLANPKYETFAYDTPVTVLLVHKDFTAARPVAASALIKVDDVYEAIRVLLGKFNSAMQTSNGISERASVHPFVTLGEGVAVGTFSIVEEGSKIGDGTVLHPQVFVGKNVEIGCDCIFYPGVKIYNGCKIGDRCVLHANVVIGSDGFGFAPQPNGRYSKIPQIGNVVLEDDVEIGANTTIDRATLGSTIIRKGVKLDNLVMVAHNVEIGENTVVAAQAGFAGSTKIGRQCRIGGQSGFVGHITVADGTQVQAQSGVAASVEAPGTALYGSPALPYNNYLRSYAIFKKLPDVYKKIIALEKKLHEE